LNNVGDVMTPNPVTVSVNTSVTKVRSILRDESFRCVPVVSGKHLEGTITRGDMMRISATKSNIEARGIMEHPKVITTPEVDVSEIGKKIIDADIIQAPVVKSEDNMTLIGIISVADILENLLDRELKPKKQNVGEVTTRDVVTCNYDDPLSKVWDKMDDTGFSGLPVIKKKKIIGMITRKDIINSGHVRLSKEGGVKKPTKVESVMKTPPIAITEDKDIKEAAKLMVKYNIGRLPVVDHPVRIKKEPERVREAELVGIITREDVLGSYIN
jgi:CBS domain-containing protein